MESWMPFFVAVTALAVVLQACMMAAIFFSVRNLSQAHRGNHQRDSLARRAHPGPRADDRGRRPSADLQHGRRCRAHHASGPHAGAACRPRGGRGHRPPAPASSRTPTRFSPARSRPSRKPVPPSAARFWARCSPSPPSCAASRPASNSSAAIAAAAAKRARRRSTGRNAFHLVPISRPMRLL